MSLLVPDRYFSRLSKIDIDQDLLANGFLYALIDVDDTVRSRSYNAVPNDIIHWISSAQAKGVILALYSNSWHKRTQELALDLDLPLCMRSMKPLPFGMMSAKHVLSHQAKLQRNNTVNARRGDMFSQMPSRKNTVVIGDQLFTDVLSAHLYGYTAYLIIPLSEITIRAAKWQRALEAKLLEGMVPEGAH